MNLNEIKGLIQAVSESDIERFEYKDSEYSVKLCKAESKTPMVSALAKTEEQNEIHPVLEDSTQEEPMDGQVITAPLVGTFYAAPAENADAYVEVGKSVNQGDVVCIVEAMKLMNEVESEFSGTISKIFVQNGQMVEYGQPLMAVRQDER